MEHAGGYGHADEKRNEAMGREEKAGALKQVLVNLFNNLA